MFFIDVKSMGKVAASIEENISKIENEIKKLPEGKLYVYRHKNGEAYYRKGYYDDDGHHVEYLLKSDISYIKQLAEQMYLNKLLNTLSSELKAINSFIRNYDPEAKGKLLDHMDHEFARLVEPEFLSQDEADKIWRTEEYDRSSDHPEALRYKTLKGDMVRSKTEVLLADLFHYHSLAYRYEAALHLPSGYTCHPDFTIRRKSDGKIFYWEHLGRIDSPNYLENSVYKLNQYAKAGIILGDNLLITWETANQPFDRTAAEKYIELLKA